MPVEPIHQLEFPPDAIAALCQRWGIRWLAIFGSNLRGTTRPDSDVDVLYELKPGRQMGYIAMESLSDDLRKIFGGRDIDLARPGQLHWLIRDEILRGAKVLYAE